MKTLLSMLFTLSIPAAFGVAIAYFYALNVFRKKLANELPDVWSNERSSARPLESWIPSAYRLLQKFRDGKIDGQAVSVELAETQARAKKLLYFGVFILTSLLLSGLLYDAISQ